MKPSNLKTKIFLDSGDPAETQQALQLLGFLDGQTTNPSLIAKNPNARERFERGDKFTSDEILTFYKEVVQEVSKLTPDGSVSVEVYADENSTADEMIKQGKEMFTWIPNAHIKLPISSEGLKAAEELSKDGVRLNMTLCFTQEQAAAVYAATMGQKGDTLRRGSEPALSLSNGQVFVSPFIGRLDDRGENGMDLIANIIKMYSSGDGHVELLSASVRNLDHFLYALQLKSDIITAPFKILKEWAELGTPIPESDYVYEIKDLSKISYQDVDLHKNWQEHDIKHDLTDKGIERFAADWNSLIKS